MANFKNKNCLKFKTTIRPGPNAYVTGDHALNELDDYIKEFTRPVIISGHKSLESFKKFYHGNNDFPIFHYDGTSSFEDAVRLAGEINGADCIIAVGGGKLTDTAKVVGDITNTPVITIPTLISTCSPYRPMSIIYNQQTLGLEYVYYLEYAPYMCIVDYSMLLNSPIEYLESGLSDTLAKYYETRSIIETEEKNGFVSYFEQVGLKRAAEMRDKIINECKTMLDDHKNNRLSLSFKDACDMIFAVSGQMTNELGRLDSSSGAHSVHDGMTHIRETDAFSHGIKVAYGILVQLVVEKRFDELDQLMRFYSEMGWPTKLSQFNIKENLQQKMQTIAEIAASEEEMFHLAVPDITKEMIVEAMEYLETK